MTDYFKVSPVKDVFDILFSLFFLDCFDRVRNLALETKLL